MINNCPFSSGQYDDYFITTFTNWSTKMKNLKLFSDALNVHTGANGTEYVGLPVFAPKWMGELGQAAHCGMMPDDTRWEMIMECAEALTEYDEISTDNIHEIADGLVDIYTHDLLQWLASRNDRLDYIDKAQNDGLLTGVNSEFERLTIGQFCEYEEILSVLISTFEDMEGDDDE